ncbi:hypothetical protein AN639_02320 [Candidatus Epulonipiscium fishelsonii]|uniref:Uncharacterized protein n=1 Tax=Candidatus Epulonipiscium fishelsonii TaxID=77094 RepID=A0ACC8XHS9_9FIRM|nr:hypothetical protein AN639_02320 [Epulopiscium sp. SCG-B05WGA-EpuloA1]ONI43007.1 hypothetical protein AN396_00155 [Epulopiscium sp. SCG-B11WGA-EpuloA1]ONI47876.1 hypothetical protein AN644_03570 [Epulopiscium sp. SCG-C06WGA-EpuloA1]
MSYKRMITTYLFIVGGITLMSQYIKADTNIKTISGYTAGDYIHVIKDNNVQTGVYISDVAPNSAIDIYIVNETIPTKYIQVYKGTEINLVGEVNNFFVGELDGNLNIEEEISYENINNGLIYSAEEIPNSIEDIETLNEWETEGKIEWNIFEVAINGPIYGSIKLNKAGIYYVEATADLDNDMTRIVIEVIEDEEILVNGFSLNEPVYSQLLEMDPSAILQPFPIEGNEIFGKGEILLTAGVGYSQAYGTRNHNGIDFGDYLKMGSDTPNLKIVATVGGVVTRSEYESTAGNWVRIIGDDGLQYEYMHMINLPLVKVGDRVQAGTHLGYMGNTGSSNGKHLHYEVDDTSIKVGEPLNPLTLQRVKDIKYPIESVVYYYFDESISEVRLPSNSNTYVQSWSTPTIQASNIVPNPETYYMPRIIQFQEHPRPEQD